MSERYEDRAQRQMQASGLSTQRVTVTKEQADTPPSPVETEMLGLEENIHSLGEAIKKLGIGLGPVLATSTPEEDCEGGPMLTDPVPLVNRIRSSRYAVNDLEATVRSLLLRLGV